MKYILLIFFAVSLAACSTRSVASSGFKVQSVDKGSTLSNLGIRPGDVIQEIDGVKLKTINDAQRALAGLTEKLDQKKQDSLQIKVLRDNKIVNLNFKIR